MRIALQVIRGDTTLFENNYDITDSASFARAFADVWNQFREAQFQRETSIGALMDHPEGDVLNELIGAHIRLRKG